MILTTKWILDVLATCTCWKCNSIFISGLWYLLVINGRDALIIYFNIKFAIIQVYTSVPCIQSHNKFLPVIQFVSLLSMY